MARIGVPKAHGQRDGMKRTQFITAASVAGALAATRDVSLAAMADVPGGRDLVEPHSAFDASAFDATLGKKADIRQVWENLGFKPGVFNNIKNSLNGLQFGFGYAPASIAMATANHGPSSAYTYSDEIWSKYKIGEFFDLKDKAGAQITSNVFYARKSSMGGSTDPNNDASMYQDTSIAALQARGVVFLTCHTAVEEQSRALVKAGRAPAGMTGSDVAADILTHLVPGAFVVPSMVATVAVLQHKFGYTYITIQS